MVLSISEDNIYAFDTGKPHHLFIDASDYPNAHGRYINDIDPRCNKNCHPEKFFHQGKIGIKFVLQVKLLKRGKNSAMIMASKAPLGEN